MPQDDHPPKSTRPSSRLRQTSAARTQPPAPPNATPRTTRTVAQPVPQSRPSSRTAFSLPPRNPSPVKRGSSTVLNVQPRPSSRTALSSTPRPGSPTKLPVQPDIKTPSSHATRPLWNSAKPNNALTLTSPAKSTASRPSHRPGSHKPGSGGVSSDSSFGNMTFVSAASGIDENRPPPSPGKLKDLRAHQPSILAGLGFGKMGQAKSSLLNGIPMNSNESAKPASHGTEERTIAGYDPKKEPIKAYLRIRPPNSSSSPRSPYIEILNDTEVLLTPPSHASRTSLVGQEGVSAKYKFTRVYGPEATQQEFFQGAGLPLVGDLIEGRSSLCFAYGVTASGKTYTVQGGLDTVRGGGSMDPGLLPRTIDVLFNSVGQNQTELRVRPARLAAIEIAPLAPKPLNIVQRTSFAEQTSPRTASSMLKDDTVLPVDPNAEYGIWISYAEVYNEKVYDLLDSITESSSSSGATIQSFTASIAEQVKNAAQLLHSKASSSGGVIKRKALVLKHDRATGNKYVHGLTEIRVRTAEEAKILLRHGQVNRTVFSTCANRTSSRSHGIFTIKLLKLPQNAALSDSLLSLATVSRLSIVDLAGSERTRNTQTTGQRLKEAGNINKSLMVLGQCMETLRKNQEQRERMRKMAIVPFRHSKLTELFQSFFTGEGKTVMIVNVNPCDTGFDENSHVMKFSAVASEVATVREERIPNIYHDHVLACTEPEVNESSFIVEDEEDHEEGDEQEGETEELTEDDGFVDHLLEQVSMLRVKLVEAEIRAAMIEAEVRDEVMQEYNQRMLEMEELFAHNLATEAKEAEMKTDRKIDIFNRATQHLSHSRLGSGHTRSSSDGSGAEETDGPEPSPTPLARHTRQLSGERTEERGAESQTLGVALDDDDKEADSDDPVRRESGHDHQEGDHQAVVGDAKSQVTRGDHGCQPTPARQLRSRNPK